VGQRANLILVKEREHELFYSHWCANTLPRDLFWGPDHAMAFIKIQRPVDDSGWLDDVWAEGGALLDFDRKHFLLFGGEDVLYDVPLRRTFLELLAEAWKRWTIRWAYEGIADLADCVGYPRDRVLSKKDQDRADVTLTPPEQNDWADLVASVRFDDGAIRLYPLAGDLPSYLSVGSKLADDLRMADGHGRLLLDEWTTQFPTGGFHLDLSAQRLDFWLARDAPDIVNRVGKAWAGWETHWHRDRFETQIDRTEGLLRFPLRGRQVLLDCCREMLLLEPGTSPISAVETFAAHEREKGKEVQVNTWAFRDDRLQLPREQRIAILEEALARLLER
jgi:hypothetical protein